jgi:hypothetical protein
MLEGNIEAAQIRHAKTKKLFVNSTSWVTFMTDTSLLRIKGYTNILAEVCWCCTK